MIRIVLDKTNPHDLTDKKSLVTIAALLAIMMTISVSAQSAFAISDVHEATSNGSLISSKQTAITNMKSLFSSKYTIFSWSECGHNYSGWFQP
ncbi:MAG: hypothetical protein KGI05_02605 [Thaumarchaeota archaeon]|nr:hypothetical protein [Nitrososphaerota archaeon]